MYILVIDDYCTICNSNSKSKLKMQHTFIYLVMYILVNNNYCTICNKQL